MYPKVSMVSLAYNRRQNVQELLTTLRHQTYPNIEVILVDNASPDGTADMVRRDFPEVKLIETGGNLGMVAYNLGFEAAQGDYILVMDDDGLPASDDWVAQIVARFNANPRLGIVSCTIRMRDTGQIAHDSPQFAPLGQGEAGFPGVVFNGTGAGIRAQAIRQAGYYPTYFFNWYLELHLSSRVLDHGWEVRHFPEIEVWHSRPSGSSHPSTDYYGLRNYYWYVWQLYPAGAVTYETLHRTGYHLKLWRKGQVNWRLLMKATRDALRGIRSPLRQREPISSTTLLYARWIRRHGNWHGIAQEIRPFDLELGQKP
ncbi:MAG: glycosyltransferase family 2 protein [Caldilineaceae bacterium]|nr:glycosyltransferase family 2 protein [Caldilineaceae bacterium]